MLLHGDNGSGKTTLLKLAWNVLSAAEPRGHKTAIARVPFSEFSVTFRDGRNVTARRSDSLIGTFDLIVSGFPLRSTVSATYVADEDLRVPAHSGYESGLIIESGVHIDSNQGRLFEVGGLLSDHFDMNDEDAPARLRIRAFLESLEIQPVLLGDDRELHTDKRDVTTEYRRDSRSRVVGTLESTPGERVTAELQETIGRVNRLLRSLTINAQRLGSFQEASIYLNVLKRIRDGATHPEKGDPSSRVEQLIDELEAQIPRYAEFQLITEFDPHEFRSMLGHIGDRDNRAIAASVILPYLESLGARIDALREAEKTIRLLTSHANYYLRDKQLTYSPQAGLRVRTDEAKPRPLTPIKLSSGERQMLLLLCNALLASGDRTLFLIDEPELSLGVPWQRQILTSLLDLTAGTDVQFIVATHSVEMVTANAPSLVRLVNKVG